MKKIIFLLSTCTLLFACGTKTAEVATTAAEEPAISFPNETVANGFALYGEKCTRCHKAKTVKDFSREEWNSILPNMAKKAKLEGDQEATIDAYVNFELGK